MLQQQGNNKPFIPEENAAGGGGGELEVRGGERQPDGRGEKPEREREREREREGDRREVRLDFRSLLSVIFRDGGERRERLCESKHIFSLE